MKLTNRNVINNKCDFDNYKEWNERLLDKSWGRLCILDILENSNHVLSDCDLYNKNCDACISAWLNKEAK